MNASSDLKDSFERLVIQWQIARELWKDSVQVSFAREFWDPLEKETVATIHEMENLENLIGRIESSIDNDAY